jgi:hypothetical protein
MIRNRHTYAGDQGIDFSDNIMKVESHPVPHISLLHIDSTDRVPFTTYAKPRFEIGADIISRHVNKIAMSDISISSNIPNVNPQNSNISFETPSNGWSVELTTGFYTVPDLIAHIISTLNTISGASGLTFVATQEFGNCYKIEVGVGDSFKFVSSSHIDRAEPLSGLYITNDFVNSIKVSADGLYTRFIDFISRDVRDSQIIENLFTKDYSFSVLNHFYRYDVITGDKPYVDKIQISNLSYNTVRNKEKNIIDLEVYNQFGDLIYSPVMTYGTQTVNIEIFKYKIYKNE